MTKDEALKMAIEALEMHVPYYIKDKGCDALIACKEALEQEAHLVSYAPDKSTCTLNIDGEEVYFNQEQPAQEPAYQVGEIVNPYGSNIKIKQPTQRNFCERCGKRASKDQYHIHTCTPPPALKQPSWQGLSDDDIDKIYYKTFDTWSSEVDVEFGHAIEQALKEKNNVN